MALNFPTSPVDKQVYVYASTGAQYVYDAANTRWTTNTFIANVVSGYYGAAYDTANAAYASGNSNWTVQNVIYSTANSAYDAANNVGPQIAPTYNTANAAYGAANNIANGVITINNISLSGNINPGTVSIVSQTLTDSANISWNMATAAVASITLGGNRYMDTPTNMKVGTLVLHVNQDGSGNRTLTWSPVFKWPAGVAPVLTTTGNRKDIFSFICDGTNLYGSYLPDVR